MKCYTASDKVGEYKYEFGYGDAYYQYKGPLHEHSGPYLTKEQEHTGNDEHTGQYKNGRAYKAFM